MTRDQQIIGASIVFAGAVVGCAVDVGAGNSFDGDGDTSPVSGATRGTATSGAASSAGTETSASTEASGADGADSTGGIKYDLGAGGDAGVDILMGCQKVDFLFVVDNSGSMGAHQARLVSSFPLFMQTVFNEVTAQDYNIMVVDSDAGADLAYCAGCNPACGPDFCGNEWTDCESTLGAGEIAPYTCNASNTPCELPDGKRFINSEIGETTIQEKFGCMAKVGTCGSAGERAFSAMVEAVTTQATAGECNDGFLRDDAVLVVTVITDDYPVTGTNDDASTVGTIDAWYDALVTAKHGLQDNIVMLGIINLEGSTCVQDGSAGGPAVHPTQKFVDFVAQFGERGIVGDICSEPDYSQFFAEAVAVIDTACDEFEPPK